MTCSRISNRIHYQSTRGSTISTRSDINNIIVARLHESPSPASCRSFGSINDIFGSDSGVSASLNVRQDPAADTQAPKDGFRKELQEYVQPRQLIAAPAILVPEGGEVSLLSHDCHLARLNPSKPRNVCHLQARVK